jgi:thiol-disulfide isomerase/thioredoxin
MSKTAAPTTLPLALLLALAVVFTWSSGKADPVDFTLRDLDGKPVSLSDYRGRWVVINFWASWCSPCIRELPELVKYQANNPDAQVIGINFEETSSAESKAFLQPFDINFPNLKIGDKPLVPLEPLDGLPTTIIIDPAGEVVERHMGPVTAAHLEAVVGQRQGH